MSGLTAETDDTINDIGECVEIGRYRLNDSASRIDREIQIENRNARFNNGSDAERFTCQHTHCDVSIGRLSGGNFRCGNLLIARADHLVRLRQIHPELQAMKRSSRLSKFLRRLFRVDNTAARCHPLDVTRSQLSFVPLGILVTEASGQHIGYCFKAAVRMIRSAFRFSRPDIHWTHLVEQQEWIEIGQCVRRKWAVNQKACTFQRRDGFDEVRKGTNSHEPSYYLL